MVIFPLKAKGRSRPHQKAKIRVHLEKVKAAHLPVKGIMDLLGLEVSDLIKTNKVPGIRAEGNDLILDPQQILPPPQIQGQVTDVRIKGNQIVQPSGIKRPRLPAESRREITWRTAEPNSHLAN